MTRRTSFSNMLGATPDQQAINKKRQQKRIIIGALIVLVIIVAVLFEVYKKQIENAFRPLANWLTARESWSWVIPVSILVILSLPPLFGHEVVQLVVGLAYPLGVAIGIAIAGSILGEALCFVVFKFFFTGYVDKKIERKVRWAAVARLAQEAGFRGVMVIRYSIIPPHLANPLFSCTGMKFWLYMVTVILSLPKAIIFVALGSSTSEHSKAAKWIKVVAVLILVAVTIFASRWIQKKLNVITAEIERERGITCEVGDEHDRNEEDGGVPLRGPSTHLDDEDTSYHQTTVKTAPQSGYQPYTALQS